MSVFGFNTQGGGGGDFMPVVKYDARAGRIFRTDRVDAGGTFVSEPIDITKAFKAVIDLENLETGWMEFVKGGPPVFALARLGEATPAKPTATAKNGVRVILKLSKDCGGDKPIRELAGNAKAFLQGMEDLYIAYQKEKGANPDKLPVVVLEDTLPIKSGSGDKASTNYKPIFKIAGWAPRGDLVWSPKNAAPLAPMPSTGAPDTGSTRVDPPKAKATADADEFADFG